MRPTAGSGGRREAAAAAVVAAEAEAGVALLGRWRGEGKRGEREKGTMLFGKCVVKFICFGLQTSNTVQC